MKNDSTNSKLPIVDPSGAHDADGCAINGDPKLLAKGWVRRQLSDETRAKEIIELYTSLGFEVKTQKLTPSDLKDECAECASVACKTFVLIYTRNATKHES